MAVAEIKVRGCGNQALYQRYGVMSRGRGSADGALVLGPGSLRGERGDAVGITRSPQHQTMVFIHTCPRHFSTKGYH
ncbi:hypothetical protein AAFF_G00274010 [Aldrovandia affinis]|uniref:Uncharacterized protein n=1 Tax=Aldrovandia affinis TaxID=143900 RepID=A0AAD7SRI4_9TELE|nr:hypothetical protein AAFF_G00274010 [Aldrovandia affinis]